MGNKFWDGIVLRAVFSPLHVSCVQVMLNQGLAAMLPDTSRLIYERLNVTHLTKANHAASVIAVASLSSFRVCGWIY